MKAMTVRQLEAELNKLLKNLAGGKVDQVLDKPVIMHIQNQDTMEIGPATGWLVGLSVEGTELTLDGMYDVDAGTAEFVDDGSVCPKCHGDDTCQCVVEETD